MIDNRLDQARSQWGKVFSDFKLACEYVNSAQYSATDKESFKQEEINRLQSLISSAQKEIDKWEEVKSDQS